MNAYLEAELDCIEVDGAGGVHVPEALSVGVHSDALPLPERGLHVLLPDALDAEVGELERHVLTVDVLFAHTHLASTLAHLIFLKVLEVEILFIDRQKKQKKFSIVKCAARK